MVKAMRLLSSFMVLPSPSGPTWNVARPSGSSTGQDTRPTGSSSPPTMNTSIRFSAPIAPPVSGASTRWWPEAGQPLPELAHDGRAVRRQVDEDGARRRRGRPGVGHRGHDVGRRQRQQRDLGRPGHRRHVGARPSRPSIAAMAAASTSCTTTSLPSATRFAGDPPADVAQPDHTDRHRSSPIRRVRPKRQRPWWQAALDPEAPPDESV